MAQITLDILRGLTPVGGVGKEDAMRAKAVKSAAVLVLTLLGLLGASTAASAAGTCSSNHVCMWEDFTYSGSQYVNYHQGTLSGDKYDINGWDGDNEISSVKNTTSKTLVMYDNDNYTGTKACIAPHSSSSNLRVSHNFDNKAESFILKTSCK